MGCERLALLLGEDQKPDTPELFVAALGEEPRRHVFPLVAELRNSGLWVEMSTQDKSLKAQMRRANKLGGHGGAHRGASRSWPSRAPSSSNWTTAASRSSASRT